MLCPQGLFALPNISTHSSILSPIIPCSISLRAISSVLWPDKHSLLSSSHRTQPYPFLGSCYSPHTPTLLLLCSVHFACWPSLPCLLWFQVCRWCSNPSWRPWFHYCRLGCFSSLPSSCLPSLASSSTWANSTRPVSPTAQVRSSSTPWAQVRTTDSFV